MLSRYGDAALIFLDENIDYPYFVGMVNTATELWVRAGLPARYVVPEPVIMEQQGTAVLASAPHPAAARLIAGWLASADGIAARQRFAYSTDLLPGSSDPFAQQLHEQSDEFVYDTPETAAQRLLFMDSLQPVLQSRPGPR